MANSALKHVNKRNAPTQDNHPLQRDRGKEDVFTSGKRRKYG